LGEEHPDVAASLNSLAVLLDTQGKYDEAEPLYQRSLAIRRKVCAIHLAASSRDHSCRVLGEEHPDVATSLNNLAGLLYTQGKYDEALIYANQSLDINKRVLGNEHPSTLRSIALVASILKTKGDYAAAEPFMRQVISGRTRILGSEHPDVATSLNNLAGLLQTQGKYNEAEPLYQQSLAIWRKVCAIHLAASSRDHSCKVLGEEHPNVATSLNNLAALLEAQGKYDEAEPLYQQSLAIMRKVCAIHLTASSRDHSCKVLGEEHPHVAASLNNLAVLLHSAGRSEEANVYGRQALAILTRALGPSHPTTQQWGVSRSRRSKRFMPSMRGVCCLLSRMCLDTTDLA
jgi:Tfp pilus assembly protein PilF